jgi:hypothetical protein
MNTRPTFTQDPERYQYAPRTLQKAFDYLQTPAPMVLTPETPKTLPHEWALYIVAIVAAAVLIKVV